MMKLSIESSYETLSSAVADAVLENLQEAGHPLFCPASGDTPGGLYNELVQRQRKGLIDTERWHFVGLDEWSGMNAEDQGSCRYYLDRQLFWPLNVQASRICMFNGKAGDAQKECELTERFIDVHNGIDVVVLGLGMNGHVGMNEPGVNPALFSHVAELDVVTKQVGQKYFSSAKELTKGLTLGIASIMKADRIILMVSGEKKASILQQVIEGDITPSVPASLLRNHPAFGIFIDEAAAKNLRGKM